MKIGLGLIKQTIPELTWEIENENRAVAKSGILKFYITTFGRQFEISIFDTVIGRNIFVLMNSELEHVLNILKLHCQKLSESLVVFRA